MYFRTLLLCVLVLEVGGGGTFGDTAQIDWQKHCIDGVELSGNYDVRYLEVPPRIGVTIEGVSQGVANQLVDGGGRSGPSWPAESTANVELDLRAKRLVSGIVWVVEGDASWRIAASLDGRRWHSVPEERFFRIGELEGAANLAVAAQFVRLTATAGSGGVTLSEVRVFGEREADMPTLGGIYPSWTPPVAGEEVTLRAVVRNASTEVWRDVEVRFQSAVHSGKDNDTAQSPHKRSLGRVVIPEVPARTARIAAVRWRPEQTDPHRVTVTVSGGSLKKQTQSRIIPVVNRRLYFGSYHPLDNERLKYGNLYTSVGSKTSLCEYLVHKFRGRIALAAASGGHTMPDDYRADQYVAAWSANLKMPLADGIAMDEFGTLSRYPEACKALERLREKYPDQMLVPWLIGGASEEVKHVHLVLCETYLDMYGHDLYRHYLNNNIDTARRFDVLDKWLIALGTGDGFGSSSPTMLAQIEREVRYLRFRGPEMPGVAFYGYDRREEFHKFDAICYQYFIAPVITFKARPAVRGDAMHMVASNIGGMTARNVKVALQTQDGKRILRTITTETLRPGEATKLVFRRPPPGAVAKILPAETYTELNLPGPVEVQPSRVVRGGLVTLWWTPEGGLITGRQDRFEVFKKSTGNVLIRTEDDGRWEVNNGNLQLKGIPTQSLPPGDYGVRLVDGDTDAERGVGDLTVVPIGGRFGVTKINGHPWKGDSQQITITAGDTFEVTWDISKLPIGSPHIFATPPGHALRAPLQNKQYTEARLNQFCRIKKDWSMMRTGSWTWKSGLQPGDLVDIDRKNGWLRNGDDPESPWLNMSRAPGVWHLWISQNFMPETYALPMTPVVTVEVKQAGP